MKKVIRDEVYRQKNLNTGYGMLMFADESIVKDFKHLGKTYFHKNLDRNLLPRDIERL